MSWAISTGDNLLASQQCHLLHFTEFPFLLWLSLSLWHSLSLWCLQYSRLTMTATVCNVTCNLWKGDIHTYISPSLLFLSKWDWGLTQKNFILVKCSSNMPLPGIWLGDCIAAWWLYTPDRKQHYKIYHLPQNGFVDRRRCSHDNAFFPVLVLSSTRK